MKVITIEGLARAILKLLEVLSGTYDTLAARVDKNEEHIRAIATPYLHRDGTTEYHLTPIVAEGVTYLPEIYTTEGGCQRADYTDKEE